MADDLRERLDAMSTDELVQILEARDASEWREEVFPMVESILQERGVAAPQPRAPSEDVSEVEDVPTLASVATFGTAMEASFCRAALAEAGIKGWLSTEYLAGVHPPLGLAIGVDVLVTAEDADQAREVLKELDAGEGALAVDPEPCPKCASTDTDRDSEPDRTGALAGWALTGLPRPAVRWRWVCRNCNHEWE